MRTLLVVGLSLVLGAASQNAHGQDTLSFALQGNVFGHSDNLPIAGATIEVWGTDGTNFTGMSDARGHFYFSSNGEQRFISANTSYSIRISAEHRYSVVDQISTVGLTESNTFVKEYFLTVAKPIIDAAPIIFFGHQLTQLDREGLATADTVATMLNDNPNLVVELRGHCNPDEDTTLAVRRGEAVRHYLMERGIDGNRLKVRSFGAREPLWENPITELKGMTQAEVQRAMAWNRRVELSAVSFDYHR